MLIIEELVEGARYSSILESLINDLGCIKVLRLNYESNYSGYVDIDVLLKNKKVFSYKYYYGSCSGCDDWEGRGLEHNQIMAEMYKKATIFSIKEYKAWIRMNNHFSLMTKLDIFNKIKCLDIKMEIDKDLFIL